MHRSNQEKLLAPAPAHEIHPLPGKPHTAFMGWTHQSRCGTVLLYFASSPKKHWKMMQKRRRNFFHHFSTLLTLCSLLLQWHAIILNQILKILTDCHLLQRCAKIAQVLNLHVMLCCMSLGWVQCVQYCCYRRQFASRVASHAVWIRPRTWTRRGPVLQNAKKKKKKKKKNANADAFLVWPGLQFQFTWTHDTEGDNSISELPSHWANPCCWHTSEVIASKLHAPPDSMQSCKGNQLTSASCVRSWNCVSDTLPDRWGRFFPLRLYVSTIHNARGLSVPSTPRRGSTHTLEMRQILMNH